MAEPLNLDMECENEAYNAVGIQEGLYPLEEQMDQNSGQKENCAVALTEPNEDGSAEQRLVMQKGIEPGELEPGELFSTPVTPEIIDGTIGLCVNDYDVLDRSEEITNNQNQDIEEAQ
ncbi:uncharacterized protein LOC134665491 [Cydia fagiglandana]|uniref:uncharacterized protein LOC134665491 n=1 Tax=Cydia fagiglandana TaxID=1458189 RepID=UPI002FEE2C8F